LTLIGQVARSQEGRVLGGVSPTPYAQVLSDNILSRLQSLCCSGPDLSVGCRFSCWCEGFFCSCSRRRGRELFIHGWFSAVPCRGSCKSL